MNVALWLAIIVLGGAVVYLLLVVGALVRSVADIRARADATTGLPQLHAGVPVGTSLRELAGTTASGVPFSEAQMLGSTWFLLFAHPGCAPCEDLVPALSDPALTSLPATVIVAPDHSRGSAADWMARFPSAAAGPDVTLVFEDGSMSSQLNVDITPYAFVIDERGEVRAHAAVSSIEHVFDLLHRGRATVGSGR